MNKFTKGCLITALVLLLIGTAFFVAGTVAGGFGQAVTMAENGELNYSLVDHTRFWNNPKLHVFWESEDTFFNDNQKILDGDFTQEYNANEIEQLEIEIAGGGIDIQESDKDQIVVVGTDTDQLQCYQEDGILHVIGQEESMDFHGKVIIYLPKGKFIDEANLQIGGGEVNISDLSTENLVINMGGGQVSADRIISKSADIEIGAGESRIKDSEIEDVTISVGMGSSYFSGLITGDLSANNSMGSIILELNNSQMDHNYTISCEAGNVELGNDRFSGLAYDKEIDNGAEHDFELDCSMGNIQVRFQ